MCIEQAVEKTRAERRAAVVHLRRIDVYKRQLIKCVEEKRQGNREFEQARRSTEEAIRAMRLPAADCFLEEFLPAFELTLDEQN